MIRIATISLLVLLAASCDEQQPATAGDAGSDAETALMAGEGQAKADFAIDGMHCEGCVAGVETRVIALDGVAAVHCDLETGRTQVIYDPTRTDDDAIARSAIEGAQLTIAPEPEP